jgi:hypothetical protein
VAFHASGGPFSGQESSKFFSVETPSRTGPRHCGQSPVSISPPDHFTVSPATETAIRQSDKQIPSVRRIARFLCSSRRNQSIVSGRLKKHPVTSARIVRDEYAAAGGKRTKKQ